MPTGLQDFTDRHRTPDAVAVARQDPKVVVRDGMRQAMNGSPTVSRFLIRQDARGTWMIWDRERRGPAEPKRITVGLTRPEAEELAWQLKLDPTLDLARLFKQ